MPARSRGTTPPSPRTASVSAPRTAAARRAPPAAVDALAWIDRTAPPLALPLDATRWSLGSGPGELVIPRTHSTKVSRVHALVTRTATGVTLTDAGSKNGLAATAGGPRVATLDLAAGQIGWVADVGLQALSPPIAQLRRHLAWRLGLTAHTAIATALAQAVDDRPLLLLTPVAADAVGLATEIHAVGPRRDNPLLGGARPPSLDAALGGTVVLELAHLAPLPQPYVQRLLAGHGAWRIILIASTPRLIQTHVSPSLPQLDTITLIPLTRRRAEVREIVAAIWADLDTARPLDDLGGVVLRALERHSWPRGLDELRVAAARLLAYVTYGAVRPATAALGISHQALTAHFARLGFGAVDIGRPPSATCRPRLTPSPTGSR